LELNNVDLKNKYDMQRKTVCPHKHFENEQDIEKQRNIKRTRQEYYMMRQSIYYSVQNTGQCGNKMRKKLFQTEMRRLRNFAGLNMTVLESTT